VLWAIEHGIPTIEINPGGTAQRAREFRLRLRAAEALPACSMPPAIPRQRPRRRG
jgi:hypothetical protein